VQFLANCEIFYKETLVVNVLGNKYVCRKKNPPWFWISEQCAAVRTTWGWPLQWLLCLDYF